MRILLLLLVALIVAGGTGYYALLKMRQPPGSATTAPIAEAPKLPEVIVALVDLPVGAIIKPQDLDHIALDQNLITPQMVVADAEGEKLLTGSVARQFLSAGVPIARSATVQPGDRGFLAAVLPKGKRAISIPINETSGLFGLALPGDRVDVILTYSLEGGVINASREIHASETVVSNLRVLALDSLLDKNDPNKPSVSNASQQLARTATLEVTPREAELISLATTLGTLSLTLNSVFDGGDAPETEAAPLEQTSFRKHLPIHPKAEEVRTMTLDSDVTSLLRRPAKAAPGPTQDERKALIQIVRGPKAEDIELGPQIAMQPAGTSPTPEPAAALPN